MLHTLTNNKVVLARTTPLIIPYSTQKNNIIRIYLKFRK